MRDLKTTLKAFAPFSAAAALAWLTVLVGARIDWVQYAVSSVLALIAGGLAVEAMRRRGTSPWSGVAPAALLFLAAVGVLRNSVGGTSSGASALTMIPVFLTALYSRSRRDLAVVVAGVGLFYVVPIVFIGGGVYPASQSRMALLSVAVSALIGFATQGLMHSIRRQAAEARHRERMLERLGDVVHGLFDSPQARAEVCEAAKSITDAAVALLYEPTIDDGELRCTAMTTVDRGATGVVAGRDSAVHEVFRTRRPALIADDVRARVGSVALWEASGRPGSVLFQPLIRDGVALGVLVVAWTHRVGPADSGITVAALLAHEAAAAIARADVLNSLADEAQTDPLTGLPNRRAWDAQLKRVLTEDAEVTVAMLDFDHFKEFNDTFGHPAGDRLLKETAAAWRDQLRVGDVLARLGGEEFGLLLLDCDAVTATEVTERLRGRVSQNRTCSAGIAIRRPGESADAVLARADRALYDAKSGGRDRTCLTTVA
ncbi:MAG TPA: sensor domain-containing diguanylate cyclase [Solirubrobacteraceae bacterium]|nr:sensor domain-containing diguanylate cyclase [Solirubrobacteraceae bacterium]